MLKPILTAAVLIALPLSASAQSAQETRFMKSVLKQVQVLTMKAGREYCGYIGYDQSGKLKATPAKRGRADSCRAREPDPSLDVIASYHSHGTFDQDADSELPSLDDMLADADEEVNGWLVTPGGRIWYIDSERGVTRQICGRNCVPADPNFEPEIFGPIKKSYTLRDLERRDAEG